MRRALIIALLLGGCTLVDNPREEEARGEFERRVATERILSGDKDLAVDWDSKLSNDLKDGVGWAATVEGRSLGGTLIRMLTIAEKRPRAETLTPASEPVIDPKVSAGNAFICYRKLKSEFEGQRLWIASIPNSGALLSPASKGSAPKSGVRKEPASGAIAAYALEGRFEHFRWSSVPGRFAAYSPEKRALVVGEVYVDFGDKQVKLRVMGTVRPSQPVLTCAQVQWMPDGKRTVQLWRMADGQLMPWLVEYSNRVVIERLEVDFQERLRPTILQFQSSPFGGQKGIDQLLVETNDNASVDADARLLWLWNIKTKAVVALPGLSGRVICPRWIGAEKLSYSRVEAGLAEKGGSRWNHWLVFALSWQQALGTSDARPRRLSVNLAAHNLDPRGDALDEHFTWLCNGEAFAMIDPETRKNIVLSDLEGANRLDLLLDRTSASPPITWLQASSSRPSSGDAVRRDYLYFLEAGGALKRIEVSPLAR